MVSKKIQEVVKKFRGFIDESERDLNKSVTECNTYKAVDTTMSLSEIRSTLIDICREIEKAIGEDSAEYKEVDELQRRATKILVDARGKSMNCTCIDKDELTALQAKQ